MDSHKEIAKGHGQVGLCVGLCVVLACLFAPSHLCKVASAATDKPDKRIVSGQHWRVKRQDRHHLIQRRLESLLLRKPMSSKHLGHLWRLCRGLRAKRQLIARFQKKAKQRPAVLSLRLLLARLLLMQGDRKGAIPHLLWVQQRRPRWSGPIRLLFQVRLRLGQLQHAMLLFGQVWRDTRGQARAPLLREVTRLALRRGHVASIARLLPLHQKAGWSAIEEAQFARLWLAYRRVNLGLAALARAANSAKGEQRYRLQVEAIEAMVQFRLGRRGLAMIASLRQATKLPLWAQDALLRAELAIHRRGPGFPAFLQVLRKRWLSAKGLTAPQRFAVLVRLAGYFASIQSPDAVVLARKALLLRHSARKPRLYVIQHLFRLRRLRDAYREMGRLIADKRAEPTEMVDWARFVLRTHLDRPHLPEWESSWRRRRICRELRHKPRVMPQQLRRCLLRRSCVRWLQCGKDLWEPFRRQAWRDWQQRATPKERALFARVTSVLGDLVRRFSGHWGAVFAARKMLADLGDTSAEKIAYKALLRHVQPIAAQVKPLLALMSLRDDARTRLPLLQRLLEQRSISPLHALQLASLARATIPSAARICPSIRRSLQRSMHRLDASFVKQQYPHALRMIALRWACGERTTRLYRWMSRLSKTGKRPDHLSSLLRVATRARMRPLLVRLFSESAPHAAQKALATEWSKSWTELSTSGATMKWIGRLSSRVFARNPWPLYRWFGAVCEEQGACRKARHVLFRLLRDNRFPLHHRFAILLTAHRNLSLGQTRVRWMQRFLKTPGYRLGPAVVLGHGALFYDLKPLPALHLRLMNAHFASLVDSPKRISRWTTHLQRHMQIPSTQPTVCHLSQKLLTHFAHHTSGDELSRHARSLGALVHSCWKAGQVPDAYFRSLRMVDARRQQALFRFWVTHRLTLGIQHMLQSQPSDSQGRRAAADGLLQKLLPSQRRQFVDDVQLQCFQYIDRVPAHIPAVIARVCRADRALCGQIFRCFYPLMHSRNVTPERLLSLLGLAASQIGHTPAYVAFLTRVFAYWKESFLSEGWIKERDFSALSKLAMRPALFRSASTLASSQLASLHFAILVYVLSHRVTLPENALLWREQLRHYLGNGNGNAETSSPLQQGRMIALQKAGRGSVVVRSMLFWLTNQGTRYVAALQEAKSQHSLERLSTGQEKLLLLGPHYQMIRNSQAVEQLWRSWFAQHPLETTRKAIARWTKRCCLDRVSQRMALRLMKIGLQRHGVFKMRIEILRILPKLSAKQQQSLYRTLGGYQTYFQQRMQLQLQR